MKIIRQVEKEEQDILEFETEYSLDLIVKERPKEFVNSQIPKYYAYFNGVELLSGGMLISKSGDGNTIDEAVTDYCRNISNSTLVFGAYTSDRKEFNTPKLFYNGN